MNDREHERSSGADRDESQEADSGEGAHDQMRLAAMRKRRQRKKAEGGQSDEKDGAESGGGAEALPPAVEERLKSSFGELPRFEVVIDPSKVPNGAHAASDRTHLYLRDRADLENVELVAHEVAHIIQQTGGGHRGGDQHQDASEKVGADGRVDAAVQEGGDETGGERRSVEEVADKAAADVEAGNRVAEMSNTPVTEGEMYLKPADGKLPAKAVHIVMFPGEETRADDYGSTTTVGHLYVYVNGKLVKAYGCAGGPPPGQERADRGGHTAGNTPAGEYSLGSAQHHTTQGWPGSVVPWGAQLREQGGEIEYSVDGKNWRAATGENGDVTLALIKFQERSGTEVTPELRQTSLMSSRQMFYDASGKVMETYEQNDFGQWAFNLQKENKTTPYYLHTTPDDEAKTKSGQGDDVKVGQSHGCVHVRPIDRAEMMKLQYLQKGVRFTVKKYGLKGP